jgi:very-short-patch-repair endonuclease
MTPSYRKRPRGFLPPPYGENPSLAMDWRSSISRRLRANASAAEHKLGQARRRKQMNSLRLRPQFSLGPYFVDFVCLQARPIVEIDGSQHGDAKRAVHHGRCTAWLKQSGFGVARLLAKSGDDGSAAYFEWDRDRGRPRRERRDPDRDFSVSNDDL